MTMQFELLGRPAVMDGDRGRAALFLQECNVAIIKARAGQRQKRDVGLGGRAPAGIAGARVTVGVIAEKTPGAGAKRVTEPGCQTAVRALPRALACLGADDPRRRAALMFADACERIGSVGGGASDGGNVTKGEISDGGVTTKIKHAARFKMVEAIANGWGSHPVTGRILRGSDRVVLAVRRKQGDRQDIKAFDLLVAHCVEGRDHSETLRRHGWSRQAKYTRALIGATWEMLGDIAVAFGFDQIGAATKVVDG